VKIIAETVPPEAPAPPHFDTEEDRQKALQTLEDLIQRTDCATNRALYVRQRERILQAAATEQGKGPLPPLGPFPPH
jgi:hypothetical protein